MRPSENILDGIRFSAVCFVIIGLLHVAWTVAAGVFGLDRGY